ncbi:membrane protein DedA with SNARE-associated domain [Desulfohalotomaculum tongense]|uniref:DedA family protein n=1 Tax=Desulforadius tongensis TaxID=1216062 RepID=UPI00195DAC18|nr:DedA family protein [Desulforadius tongensis]MBM7855047.1 membrane protein DedA with SNARE-associated domain [Desulforadius tongensis]
MLEYIYSLIEESFAWVTDFIAALGYWGIAVGMAIESANIPLPSELILPFGGYLVSTGQLNFWGAVMAGTIGGTVGSVASYYLGLLGGRPLLFRYGRYIGISRSKIELADRWFARYGEATVFFTRLMPIIRTFISLPAGLAGMNFKKFVIYTFLGSLPWSILLTYAGVKLGENWQQIKPWFHRLDAVVAVAVLLLVVYYLIRRRAGWR